MFSLYIIFILSTIASALPTRQARILSPRALRPVTSSNWCGLVRNASPIKSVEAEWKVPYSTLPDDGSSEDMYQTYQWVGIDGTNKCGALLQGGTGQTIIDGVASYYAWYEFWPALPYYARLSVQPGDVIHVKVEATSTVSGIVYFNNKTTKESITEIVTSPGPALCLNTAAWIAEDPGNTPKPLPAFTTFNFTNSKGSTWDGKNFDLRGSQDWHLWKNSTQRLCSSRKLSNTTLQSFYDGPASKTTLPIRR